MSRRNVSFLNDVMKEQAKLKMSATSRRCLVKLPVSTLYPIANNKCPCRCQRRKCILSYNKTFICLTRVWSRELSRSTFRLISTGNNNLIENYFPNVMISFFGLYNLLDVSDTLSYSEHIFGYFIRISSSHLVKIVTKNLWIYLDWWKIIKILINQ